MTALVGFDSYEAAAPVVTPILGGATLLAVPVPAGVTLGGFDLDVSDLDTGASPTLALDVGDAVAPARFVNADTTAQAGGLLEYRPANTAWYRYNAAASVLVTVQATPSVGAVGAIALTLYGYPSVDRAVLVRQALQLLGVTAEGETPRAEDAAVTIEALADVHETLRGKRIANRQDLAWTLAAVPLFAARPYAALAANLLADTFGLSQQRATRLAARAVEGEREMRRQTAKGYGGQPVSLEPYRELTETRLDYGALI